MENGEEKYLSQCLKVLYPDENTFIKTTKGGDFQMGYTNGYESQHGSGKSFIVPKEFAELIVKAVNLHNDLVEALKALIEVRHLCRFEYIRPLNAPVGYSTEQAELFANAWNKARAVLSKIEEVKP